MQYHTAIDTSDTDHPFYELDSEARVENADSKCIDCGEPVEARVLLSGSRCLSLPIAHRCSA